MESMIWEKTIRPECIGRSFPEGDGKRMANCTNEIEIEKNHFAI
jgi:hypothetical protein